MPLIQETDFGTPVSTAATLVTLEIDGKQVTVPAGTSVMRAAVGAGVSVPKLCATDSLNAFGSCRLCLVEIEGRRGTPASCTTAAAPGMKVQTQTPRLAKLRRGVMELYISDHPLDCLTCAANGNCELQDMAGVVGLREVRYGYEGANHFDKKKDESNPYFTFEPSKLPLFAHGACGPVRKPRGRSLSPLMAGASRRWYPPATSRSSIRNAFPAGPACRPAPRPH